MHTCFHVRKGKTIKEAKIVYEVPFWSKSGFVRQISIYRGVGLSEDKEPRGAPNPRGPGGRKQSNRCRRDRPRALEHSQRLLGGARCTADFMSDLSLRPAGLQKKCVQLYGTSSGNALSYDFR